MQNVIVGIDPGTTLAYCILDMHGRVVKVESTRTHDFSGTIENIIQFGNPILVGCDKNPAPSFVERFAIKVGAKLVTPEQDLLVSEKKELVGFKTKNGHEMDACASALFAYQNHEKLIRKVIDSLKKKGKEDLLYDVLNLVIKEDMSISNSVKSLEEKEKSPEPAPVRKVEVVRPVKELEALKKNITLLEEKNEKLERLNKRLKKDKRKLLKRIKGMPVDKVVKEKNNTIRLLNRRLEERKKESGDAKKETKKLQDFIAQNAEKVIAKKLDNLSQKEFERKKWLDIRKGDILLVDDANIVSEDVLEKINIDTIIYRKKLSVRHPGFTYINADSLDIREIENFVAITKESLERALGKKDVLKRVVFEYRKQRDY